MEFPLIGPIHACAATIGLLSGCLSVILRKGSGLHKAAGTMFFGSMLIMAAFGLAMALPQQHYMNALSSSLTAYLVTTGWLSGRRKEVITGRLDQAALLFIIAVGIAMISLGVNPTSRLTQGYPSAMYFVFGTIALLFALGDVRMLLRGGVSGARRIARHLLRMCVALLFALLSLYPGQARLFPEAVRQSNIMVAPPLILIAMTIFWLCRTLIKRKQKSHAPAPHIAAAGSRA
jgi:hypothetical protein